MRRRQALAIAAMLALAAGLAVGVREHGSFAQAAPPAQRPNVLVLETDDQTLAEMQVLPNVKRLIGDQGVTFDNNFDSFSLCCPSRASFLTGQYSHNNGVRGNAPPQGGYQALDKSNTLAVWLQRGGYYTVHLGKFLNGYGRQNPTEIPPGWSEWHGAVDPTTWDAAHILRDTAAVLLPDRRLPGQGERDHPAPRTAGALLPLGRVPGRPFGCAP